MSVDAAGPGRFCNQLIRQAFASMLAQKFDLTVAYPCAGDVQRLGIACYSGAVELPAAAPAGAAAAAAPTTEDEVLGVIEGRLPPAETKISMNNDNCYCQSRQHTKVLREWLRPQAASIRAANTFAARYRNNSDVFLHIRLGDVPGYNPGVAYYRAALARTAPDASTVRYISTDTPGHPIVQQLVADHPETRVVVDGDLVKVIQFASTCKDVILSHGSFSAVIGFLAFDSHVYYAPYTTMWCGDMFSQPDWYIVYS